MATGTFPTPFPADPAQAFANWDYDNYYDSDGRPIPQLSNADVPSQPYLNRE